MQINKDSQFFQFYQYIKQIWLQFRNEISIQSSEINIPAFTTKFYSLAA